MQSLTVGKLFPQYSGVRVHAGQDSEGNEIEYFAGTDTGYVLEIDNPFATAATAQTVLDGLRLRGSRYRPYQAGSALLDPAAEIGDNVSVDGNDSIIFSASGNYGRLMAMDIAAPYEEEIDHEFPYVPKQTREFKRESSYTRSRLTVTESEISAEVVRATGAEEQLSSRISINATEIAAKVSKSGGDSASFGWTLTDSSWTLMSNNSTVLKATSTGIEITGKITATSGYIGNGSSGFEIGSTYIRNGMTSRDDTTHNGVYVGTDGIALGQGKFKVTNAGAVTASNLSITGGSISIGSNFSVNSSGNVSANNMTLTGTLNIGGTNISASDLRTGAQEAYNGYSGWNGTTSTVNSNGGNWTSAYDWKTNNGDYCVGGAGWGYNFGSMDDASNSFPINASSFRYQGTQLNPQNISFIDGNGNVRTFYGVLMYS